VDGQKEDCSSNLDCSSGNYTAHANYNNKYVVRWQTHKPLCKEQPIKSAASDGKYPMARTNPLSVRELKWENVGEIDTERT
jgi:hypothetical protein